MATSQTVTASEPGEARAPAGPGVTLSQSSVRPWNVTRRCRCRLWAVNHWLLPLLSSQSEPGCCRAVQAQTTLLFILVILSLLCVAETVLLLPGIGPASRHPTG